MNKAHAAGPADDFHPLTREYFRDRDVAVTGGAGFIGSHVVELLLVLGARPIVLTRRPAPLFLAGLGGRVRCRVADLADYAQTRLALDGASVVLSLAASVAGLEYNAAHPASIFHANLATFMNAIRAAAELRIERFLVTSSACVYPRHCSIPTPEAEGFRDEPEPTNAGYGWAKRMQEVLGAQYQRESGIEVAIARPYNAYGPRDNFAAATSHVIPALIRKAFETASGELPVWGDGSHTRSFLYVEDAARGLLEVAARHPSADPLNIGADEETSIAETATQIAALVSSIRGTPITPVFNPAGLTGQPRRRCDTRKIESVLGFRARVPLADGLRRTIDWYRLHENRSLPADA